MEGDGGDGSPLPETGKSRVVQHRIFFYPGMRTKFVASQDLFRDWAHRSFTRQTKNIKLRKDVAGWQPPTKGERNSFRNLRVGKRHQFSSRKNGCLLDSWRSHIFSVLYSQTSARYLFFGLLYLGLSVHKVFPAKDTQSTMCACASFGRAH